jgi:hypothetical protein
MEKRVGICPQPTMSSTSSNPYFFFFILATAAMSSDLHLLSFSVTCLFKKREKEKKKRPKNVHTVHWTVPVNRLPAPFDILTRPISPIFIVFHRPTAALEKRRLHFGKWKSVKAITFGAYLAKIECDTARPLESVSMVDSINSASSRRPLLPTPHLNRLPGAFPPSISVFFFNSFRQQRIEF